MATPEADEMDFLDVLSAPDTRLGKLYGLCLQIENIVTSYDDRWDAFAEMVQNGVDALLQRWDDEVLESGAASFTPLLRIQVDCVENSLAVLDNGCGVNEANFVEVFKPNFSLKRRLGQRNARGEKGAGIVFLQFGHASYRFDTKIVDWQRSYRLEGGPSWYIDALALSQSDGEPDVDSLSNPHEIGNEVDTELADLERGSFTRVVFFENSNLPRLDTYFGASDSATTRLEYILRTRTAAGFFRQPGLPSSHACLDELRLELQVTLPDGSVETEELVGGSEEARGFFFPHEMAQRRGSLSSVMTDPASNSELLYQFFDKQFLTQHSDRFSLMSRPSLVAVLDKFGVQGYMSYGYNNRYYEQLTSMLLDFEEDVEEEARLLSHHMATVVSIGQSPQHAASVTRRRTSAPICAIGVER